jgi:integrase
LQAFLAHTRDDRWYPVWYVLASTGMRRSEICGLRSESVDLERAVITVDWKVVSVHNELYEGDPKPESSIREITIDDHTVQVLREWREVKRRDRRAAREAWWTVRSNPSSRWLAGSMRPSSRSASCSVDNATRSGQP